MPPPRLLTSFVNFPPRPQRGLPARYREHEPSPPAGRARLGRGAAAGGASPPPPQRGGGRGVGEKICLPAQTNSTTPLQ